MHKNKVAEFNSFASDLLKLDYLLVKNLMSFHIHVCKWLCNLATAFVVLRLWKRYMRQITYFLSCFFQALERQKMWVCGDLEASFLPSTLQTKVFEIGSIWWWVSSTKIKTIRVKFFDYLWVANNSGAGFKFKMDRFERFRSVFGKFNVVGKCVCFLKTTKSLLFTMFSR